MSPDTKPIHKNKPEVSEVKLKSFSKMVLFYPLFIYSIIAWIIQFIAEQGANPERPRLAIIWIFIFFINLVIVSFDFPTVKFFILFLVIVVVIMSLVLLDNAEIINLLQFLQFLRNFFDVSLPARFYGWIVITLGFLILAAIIQGQFKFVKVEKNEIYIRGIASGQSDRYPTSNLRVKMKITDIFEFLSLGAGRINVLINDKDAITLDTVPFVRKKKRHIDELLSSTLVESEPEK